ncbi:hypothetical protein N825_32735 [Skermanella stibiiresistens SB22]|uniref:IclR family transcriptional regulator n=1 Tax=Skermanella stibiiresistens SB22 TaxID=1385369 RepID=W9H3D8_9PROT|nr:IclR family transcriptional regulator [Skermanella stibiiresistens]EWY40695.1 hypothetical protein N825_32735 [Skermanella stibiiresistens SB22]
MGRPRQSEREGEADKPALTRTLERGLTLLSLVARGGDLTLIDISRAASMSPSTALRLLETLRARHFVEKDASTGVYRIAIGAFEIGSSYLRQNGLGEAARAVLSRLSGELRQSTSLAVLDNSDIVYVERAEAEGPLGARARWGERLPAHSTAAGKAMLALSWESRCDEVLGAEPFARVTPRTITGRDALMAELRTIRERRYAVDDEESALGVRCIAAPVLDRDGIARAAISVSMLVAANTPERETQVVNAVLRAADRLSANLGWTQHAVPRSGIDADSVFID